MLPAGPLTDQACGLGRGAARRVVAKMAIEVRMVVFMIAIWEIRFALE
jgi:hypothetical protein